jgi:hypothetical protein
MGALTLKDIERILTDRLVRDRLRVGSPSVNLPGDRV